ncbi:7742_t:CDS:2, partial [Acaulospora colombiana]
MNSSNIYAFNFIPWKLLNAASRFKELIDGSIELQLRIGLAIDGYLLSYRGKQPAKDVAAFHEKRRSALESMKCVASWEEPFAAGDVGQYAARDGILAQSLGDPPTSGGFRTLVYKELVPPQSGKKAWVHTWQDLGFLSIDFSFWIQGDLQILIEPRDN